MSFISNVPVPDVVKSSFGLAFIAYPTAVATLPGAPFWACLFFLMLFTLGLDSQFTILETVATAITDFSVFFRLRRTLLMGLCSLVLFLLGLLCCTRTGLNWVDVIDSYVGGWAIVFSSLLEMIALGSIYGGGFWSWFKGDRKREWLIEDIEMMIGKKSNFFWFYWRLTWYLVSPIVLTAIMVWSWVIYKPMNVPTWVSNKTQLVYFYYRDISYSKFYKNSFFHT